MAGLDDLKNELNQLQKLIEELKKKNINIDTKPAEDALKRMSGSFGEVANSANKSANDIKRGYGDLIDSTLNKLHPAIAQVGRAILAAGEGVNDYGTQFNAAFSGTGIDKVAGAFDNLTTMTRSLRTSAQGVGSAMGLSYEQTRGSYESYIASTLLAQQRTYATRDELQRYSVELAKSGVSLDELTRSTIVAGAQQNFLSEALLLTSDTGLRQDQVFGMMTDAVRKMGYSVEDAGKPIVALENIARDTGLPIRELSDKVFDQTQRFARLGLTVDAMSPVLRRFSEVLGPAFKGLAIEETTKLIGNLEAKINTTEAAFIAMRGGLPGAEGGVAAAQLAFEDAFKNPVEIMKSLSTTLGGVAGGKIIKFEEARANPELANQFKLQRDLLQQLTGNTDPQSQRTLMNILSDLQSGRQLSASQNKQLEDSLKSGSQKQEEQRTLQERIGHASVGLLSEIALNTSGFFDKLLPAQAQASMVETGREQIEAKAKEIYQMAAGWGEEFLKNAPTISGGLSGAEEKVTTFMRNQEAGPGIGIAPLAPINVPSVTLGPIPRAATNLPEPTRPTTPSIEHGARMPSTTTGESTKTTMPPGTKGTEHITLTLKGDGSDFMESLVKSIVATYNKTLHGSS